MKESKVFVAVEDSIISWYSDFQNLHDLRDAYDEYPEDVLINLASELSSEISGIVMDDLYGRGKKDELLHYIIADIQDSIDWKRIGRDLYSEYFYFI